MANLPNNIFAMLAQVFNPAQLQRGDGDYVPVSAGRHGELYTRPLGGPGFVSAFRGNAFIGSSGAAGIAALQAPAGTGGAGSFVLHNPPGSGVIVNLEQIRVTNPTSTQTQIIAGLGLEGSLQTPSGTLTLSTITAFPLGAPRGAAAAKVYAAATISAMTYITGLGVNITATTSDPTPGICDFGGRMLLAPGFSVNVCATLVQTGEHIGLDYYWSEWPV